MLQENKKFKIYIDKPKALEKIKYFCRWQERSHAAVKEKLYSFGLRKNDVEALMATLIESGDLNEERFAFAYARGKFKINNWGKIKIEQGLKQQQVSAYNIRLAMQQINADDYYKLLLKLAKTKWQLLKNEQHLNRQFKTTNYLLQKGFEASLVKQAVAEMRAAAAK